MIIRITQWYDKWGVRAVIHNDPSGNPSEKYDIGGSYSILEWYWDQDIGIRDWFKTNNIPFRDSLVSDFDDGEYYYTIEVDDDFDLTYFKLRWG